MQFQATPMNGLVLKGQVRHLAELTIGSKKALLAVRNNDSTVVFRFAP
jgi:enediyne biosynthesis protein E4